MRNELITVIIPAYNSEKYINRCIDSVLNQTYKNLEVIVVNDGSTDNTANIVNTYKGVILLNKDNGGSSSARNYGIKHVNGKYVIFLDADDYLNTDFVSTLYKKTSGKNDELIVCDIMINNRGVGNESQELIIEGRNNIYDMYLQGKIYNSSVNKLYPVELIKKVSFPEGRDMLEDAYFTSHILEYCSSVIRIPYAGYNYVRHNDSLSKKKHNKIGIAGMYSNILEKDLMLSNNISVFEYDSFARLASSNIIKCFNSNKDISYFNIPSKIKRIIRFIYRNQYFIHSNKIIQLSCYLSNASTTKQLRKQYIKYVLLKESFKGKYLFMRSTIRKLIKGY